MKTMSGRGQEIDPDDDDDDFKPVAKKSKKSVSDGENLLQAKKDGENCLLRAFFKMAITQK